MTQQVSNYLPIVLIALFLLCPTAVISARSNRSAMRAPLAATADAPDVNPPVVFLHYDYMSAPWWDPSQENFSPDPAAIDRVVEAFHRHGITLVIDPQHTELPYHQYMYMTSPSPFPCAPAVCVNFYDVKEQYFHPRGGQAWHYAIFGDVGLSYGEFVGGQAEVAGYNFMVTLRFPHRQLFLGTQLDFWQDRVSGTFMHEFGHNLDLLHGGDDNENYKLNYVSVMNYSYQFGILHTTPGDTYEFDTWFSRPPLADVQHIAGIRLDYSAVANPTIDEFHLDERVGVGGPTVTTDVAYYFACGALLLLPCKAGYVRVAAAPFDWDNNGVIEQDISADINYSPNPNGELTLSVMRGYDDWSHIHEFLRTPQYLSGTLRPAEIVR